jgi:circadian clock protein KaiC
MPEKRIATGIVGLDDILSGGLPAEHLYLIEGDPGTGKTTLALQFLMEGVRAGESSLYITLSESKRELLIAKKSHGWNLDKVQIFELLPDESTLRRDQQYTVDHASDVELVDTTSAVLEQVEKLKPRRVVIDSLSELRMLAQDPLRYRRQILAFKQFFAGSGSQSSYLTTAPVLIGTFSFKVSLTAFCPWRISRVNMERRDAALKY